MAGINPDSLVYPGPFLGLDTTREPAQLGLAYATEAVNVTFANGLIEPRIPWSPLKYGEVTPQVPVNLDAPVLCFCQVRKSRNTKPVIIAKVLSSDGEGANLWAISSGTNPVLLAGAQGFNTLPGDFVLHNGWIYLLDGAERIWKTDGTPQGTYHAGIKVPPSPTTPPDVVMLVVDPAGGVPGNVAGLVNYMFSLYDSRSGVESNAAYVVAPDSELYVEYGASFRFIPDGLLQNEGADRLRLYRSRLDIGGPYRLVGDHSLRGGIEFFFRDELAEDEIKLSSVTTGPFAPQRNEPIVRANLGALLDGRLFYARLDEPGRVYYSAVGTMDYGRADDFVNVSGDEDDTVRGLVSIGEQLWVGKRDAIYSVAGKIHTATNATLATGAIPLDTEEVITKSRAKIGPGNAYGNGFVLAGTPAVVHFPTDSGFFRFDGSDVSCVSKRIKRTWREFKLQGDGLFTFADDAEHQILFVCNGWGVTDGNLPILAYHYGADDGAGLGRWSTFTGQGLPSDSGLPEFAVTAITTPVAEEAVSAADVPLAITHSQILLGTHVGYFYSADPDAMGAYIPSWRWTSGRIPIQKGGRGKVRWIKALFARCERDISALAGCVLIVAMDGDVSRINAVTGYFSAEQCVLNVRRYGRTMRLYIIGRSAWTTDWLPALGIAGLVINAAPTGQR